MPEKYDPLAAILAAKEQGIGATLRLQWRTSWVRYAVAARFTKQ